MEPTTAAPQQTGHDVEDPATGAVIATIPSSSADDVHAVAARARAAQPAWSALGVAERGRVFLRARRWLIQNRARMSDTIVRETGKTRDDAQLEITVAAQSFGFWAKKAPKYLADERYRTRSPMVFGRKVVVRQEPVGVVGVIGPWNYPLVNAFCDCVPALVAGNAVILKPSEVTPMTSLLVAEMMEAAGTPKDVFSVVPGGGETGSALVDEVDFVMFTGSTRTGERVMERASKTLTPVSLELGGKDAMIVCADADVERAANAAAFYANNNGGQVCISVERVYVEDAVYDQFLARVTEIVRGLRQGAPTGPGEIEVGAVTFPAQVDVLERHLADAREKGAEVVTGGRLRPGAGRFWEPTILTGVDHTMTCMTEESFGPTMPIMRVKDVDEAVRLANDSVYGLQASVFTKDPAKGEAIARRLEAGSVCVNDAQVNYVVFDAPMGGWKTSGVGTRHGSGGIRKYCRPQTILVPGWVPKKDVHMFPYRPRTSRLVERVVAWIYGR